MKLIGLGFLFCLTTCLSGLAQQANSSGASFDLNGSSAMGSAPYSVSVQIPGPLTMTVSGGANLPFVVVQGAAVQIGARPFIGLGALDVGPTQTVILNGYNGPTSQQIYTTGSMGTAMFSGAIPGGTTPTGVPFAAFQVVVLDLSNPPFYASISAATELTILANQAPTANAGPNQSVLTNTLVTLSGTQSTDPENATLTYSWNQTSGASVTLSSSTAASPTFTTPSGAGLTLANSTLVFELTVNDGVQNSAVDTVSVTVNVSFQNDITTIFSFSGSGCIGCHAGDPFCSGNMCLDGSNGMSGYANAFARVNTSTPAQSLLLLKPLAVAAGGVSHSGGDLFATTAHPSYLAILTWIQQGASNN